MTRDLPPQACDALRTHLQGFEKQFDELIGCWWTRAPLPIALMAPAS